MRKSVYVLASVLCAFFFMTSCQKELSFEGTNLPAKSDSLLGDWKFVSMDVKSSLSSEATQLGQTVKQVFITDFLTKNNAGTLNIDSSNLNLADLSYSLDTITKAILYINNTQVSSDQYDVSYDAPPATVSSEYKVIGADSIYLPFADFINLPAGLDAPPVTGFKFDIQGDKLILTALINVKEVDSSTTPPITYTTNVKVVITFQKQ